MTIRLTDKIKMELQKEKIIFECTKGLNALKHYCLISGGKDSIASYYIAKELVKIDGIIFIDTTIGLKETADFVKSFAKEQNIPLHVIRPKKTYEEYVKKYGFPHPNQHQQTMIELKWKPMDRFVKDKLKELGAKRHERICLISGTRAKESARRMKHASPITIDPSNNRMFFFAPLYYWSTPEVFAYKKEKGYKISPSYETLHLSGDCLCGAFAQKGEAEMIALFYPDMADYIAHLEKVANKDHKGSNGWGNGSTMKGAKSQKRIEGFICADCEIK